MLKKPAVCIALGLVGLSCAPSTLAGGNYYGYSYSNQYSEAPVPIAIAPPYVYSDSGFVLGLQGGYGNTHWSNINFDDVIDFSDGGFAGRAYLGYDINKFFGFEGGFTYLPKATSDFGHITNYAFDILAKLSLPVTGGFSIHAKAGGGFFHSSVDDDIVEVVGGSTSRSHFGPVFGVGAAYEIIPNLAIGLDWERYSGNGKISSSSYQPSPDVVFLGLSYKFPTHVG